MKTPLEKYSPDQDASYIAYTWDLYNKERQTLVDRWQELRNYIFSTDTTTTTNKSLPWKNSTTVPKLCQIRDNLHSNYISALFPNDEWINWEAYDEEGSSKEVVEAIEAYISTKCRDNGFRTEISKLLLDYIDYGNCFGKVKYVNDYVVNDVGEKTYSYSGPVLMRISPLDIVFNPKAYSFKDSFKIVRNMYSVGELVALAKATNNVKLEEALRKRKELTALGMRVGWEDINKMQSYLVDGFGNYETYLQSNYVEMLTFYGDIYDSQTGQCRSGRQISVIDRSYVVEDKAFESWMGIAPIFHCGWRARPDNLWHMGPLENLVGMQYRLDHIENAKADAFDLAIMPPLVIQGDVEEFEWKPGAEIHIDENGAVTELARNVQWVIQAENMMQQLEMRMEQYAGAPREAMGIRTPGEKTKFEVQELNNAAGRIFQEKITHFEVEFLEPVLNGFLEASKRYMDRSDIVKVIDNDIGAEVFLDITKDDITASGKLRPIGARHFAAKAQLTQNLVGISNTQVWQQIAPHINTKSLAMLVEDMLGLEKFDLFKANAAVFEGQEQAQLSGIAKEQLDASMMIRGS